MANPDHIRRWPVYVLLMLLTVVAGCGGRPAPFGKSTHAQGVTLTPPADGYRYAGASQPLQQDRKATVAPEETLTTATISPTGASRGVDVAPVVGAGATGNKELRDAMMRALMRRGVRLSTKSAPPHIRIEAQVRLGAVRAGSQSAAIEWRVRDAGGRLIGTVAQSNNIPAATTTPGWGASAIGAAQAAAPEISRLIAAAR